MKIKNFMLFAILPINLFAPGFQNKLAFSILSDSAIEKIEERAILYKEIRSELLDRQNMYEKIINADRKETQSSSQEEILQLAGIAVKIGAAYQSKNIIAIITNILPLISYKDRLALTLLSEYEKTQINQKAMFLPTQETIEHITFKEQASDLIEKHCYLGDHSEDELHSESNQNEIDLKYILIHLFYNMERSYEIGYPNSRRKERRFIENLSNDLILKSSILWQNIMKELLQKIKNGIPLEKEETVEVFALYRGILCLIDTFLKPYLSYEEYNDIIPYLGSHIDISKVTAVPLTILNKIFKNKITIKNLNKRIDLILTDPRLIETSKNLFGTKFHMYHDLKTIFTCIAEGSTFISTSGTCVTRALDYTHFERELPAKLTATCFLLHVTHNKEFKKFELYERILKESNTMFEIPEILGTL